MVWISFKYRVGFDCKSKGTQLGTCKIGVAEHENTSGDKVKDQDVFANVRMIEWLKNSDEVCDIVSEELDK